MKYTILHKVRKNTKQYTHRKIGCKSLWLHSCHKHHYICYVTQFESKLCVCHDRLSYGSHTQWFWSNPHTHAICTRICPRNCSMRCTVCNIKNNLLLKHHMYDSKHALKQLTCVYNRYNDTAVCTGKLQKAWKLGQKLTILFVSVLMKLTISPTVDLDMVTVLIFSDFLYTVVIRAARILRPTTETW